MQKEQTSHLSNSEVSGYILFTHEDLNNSPFVPITTSKMLREQECDLFFTTWSLDKTRNIWKLYISWRPLPTDRVIEPQWSTRQLQSRLDPMSSAYCLIRSTRPWYTIQACHTFFIIHPNGIVFSAEALLLWVPSRMVSCLRRITSTLHRSCYFTHYCRRGSQWPIFHVPHRMVWLLFGGCYMESSAPPALREYSLIPSSPQPTLQPTQILNHG